MIRDVLGKKLLNFTGILVFSAQRPEDLTLVKISRVGGSLQAHMKRKTVCSVRQQWIGDV
jgi:hypothetical protein